MLDGVSLALSAIPTDIIDRHSLGRRICDRGGEREVQFLRLDRECVLPVWHDGRLCVLSWGNRSGASRQLPRGPAVRLSTLEEGAWAKLDPERVIIPALLGLDRGIWFGITERIHAVVVRDELGRPVVYPIVEPSTHYYEVITRSEWMPMLVGELI